MAKTNSNERYAMKKIFSFGFKAAAVALTLFTQAAAKADEASDARKQCDVLGSHPSDPNRFAAGVEDKQFAPGAAIEACEAAVKLNPDIPREWFQLGRAYWIGKKDAEAFKAFSKAAEMGYAAAMKFVGDAYVTGRGLPNDKQPDMKTADAWYRKSVQGGFEDAKSAREELRATIEKTQFDASAFQNPEFISAIYNNAVVSREKNEAFSLYVIGFIRFLGSEQLLYVDASCKPLVQPSTTVATVNGLVALTQKHVDQDLRNGNFGNGSSSGSFSDTVLYYVDQGKRDAVMIVNRYSCKSDVAKTIADNIAARVSPGWRPSNYQESVRPQPEIRRQQLKGKRAP